MRSPKPPTERRLLEIAVDHFGRHGLEGASTRAIAAAAATTMSAITYHYGGKDGLYLAAARHIAGEIGERLSPALAAADAALAEPARRAEAEAALLAVLDRFVEVMAHDESEPWARFIVREQMDPTAAFDVIFATLGQVAARLARLVERLGEGGCGPQEARLRVVAIIGQVLAWRTARAAVLRITGWRQVDDRAVGEIQRVVRAHTHAILAHSFGHAAS